MYPIRLNPAYQHYIWGGERIRTRFHRDLPPGRYAESWEVSDREEGMSTVANGIWKGKTFRELVQQEKEKLVGKGKYGERFPLLVKIIDAKEHLSVQVHPDKKSAVGEPKNEMWIALAKSSVYAGLKAGVTREIFAKALETGHVEPLLFKWDLEEGDAMYLPAGQVHAICAGALLLEVQQNSNTTYRLYDWGRIGRELHLEQGIASIHFGKQEALKIAPSFSQADGHHRLESLISNEHFIVERLEIADRWQIKSHSKTCQILFCARGEALIENESIAPGMTYLIPALAQPMSLIGHCQLILVSLSAS